MKWRPETERPKNQVFVCSRCGGRAYYPQGNNRRPENESRQAICRYRYCPMCGEAVDEDDKNPGTAGK